jgi:hypothetical protein
MSRRRHSDEDKTSSDINAERRASRVCSKDSDRKRLLNESIWPEYVTISEWIFNLMSRKNDEHRSEQQINGTYQQQQQHQQDLQLQQQQRPIILHAAAPTPPCRYHINCHLKRMDKNCLKTLSTLMQRS